MKLSRMSQQDLVGLASVCFVSEGYDSMGVVICKANSVVMTSTPVKAVTLNSTMWMEILSL